MSQVSTIYDAIYTLVSSTLTDHILLHFAYPDQIDLNDSHYLEKGYGIYFGPMEQVDRTISCHFWQRRNLTITNTVSIYGHDTDITVKKTAEKNLLENQRLLINAFQNDITLSDNVNNFLFISDSGFLKIFPDRHDFIMLQNEFSFEYYENFS